MDHEQKIDLEFMLIWLNIYFNSYVVIRLNAKQTLDLWRGAYCYNCLFGVKRVDFVRVRVCDLMLPPCRMEW